MYKYPACAWHIITPVSLTCDIRTSVLGSGGCPELSHYPACHCLRILCVSSGNGINSGQFKMYCREQRLMWGFLSYTRDLIQHSLVISCSEKLPMLFFIPCVCVSSLWAQGLFDLFIKTSWSAAFTQWALVDAVSWAVWDAKSKRPKVLLFSFMCRVGGERE